MRSMPTLNCASQRWFHSPDGGLSHTPINSSHSKYLLQDNSDDTLILNLTDVSASDEGIYGCLEGTNDQMRPELCVKVYGESCTVMHSTMHGYQGYGSANNAHVYYTMFVVQVKQCLLRVHTSQHALRMRLLHSQQMEGMLASMPL